MNVVPVHTSHYTTPLAQNLNQMSSQIWHQKIPTTQQASEASGYTNMYAIVVSALMLYNAIVIFCQTFYGMCVRLQKLYSSLGTILGPSAERMRKKYDLQKGQLQLKVMEGTTVVLE